MRKHLSFSLLTFAKGLPGKKSSLNIVTKLYFLEYIQWIFWNIYDQNYLFELGYGDKNRQYLVKTGLETWAKYLKENKLLII